MPSKITGFFRDSVFDLKLLLRRNPNVSVFIIYGMLFETVQNMWRPFAVKFLSRLGGGAYEISLLNALPGIVAALTLIPGAAFISRLTDKKKATTAFFAASRAMLLFAAFVPLMPEALRPMVFVLLISVMGFPDSVSQTALQGVLGNVFDGRTRASAITLRNQTGNIVMPVVTILTGLAMTFIPKDDPQKILMYRFFFIFAFLVGIAEIIVFNRFRESENGGANTKTRGGGSQFISLRLIRGIAKDRTFVKFAATVLFFTFFWQSSWPLYGVYQIENLNADEFWFAIYAVASGIGAVAAGPFWQSLIRSRGNNAGLFAGAILLAVNNALYPMCGRPSQLAFVNLFSGAVTIGFTICGLNGLLGATPDENKLIYLGVYNTFLNLSLFTASLFSLFLLNTIGVVPALWLMSALRAAAAFAIFIFGGALPYRRRRSRSSP